LTLPSGIRWRGRCKGRWQGEGDRPATGDGVRPPAGRSKCSSLSRASGPDGGGGTGSWLAGSCATSPRSAPDSPTGPRVPPWNCGGPARGHERRGGGRGGLSMLPGARRTPGLVDSVDVPIVGARDKARSYW